MSDRIQKEYQVGDELAFHHGHRPGQWVIKTIGRITPTGLLVCDQWMLNQDLTVRGYRRYGPNRGQPVTDTVRKAIRRQQNLITVSVAKWPGLTDEQLEIAAEVVRASFPE